VGEKNDTCICSFNYTLNDDDNDNFSDCGVLYTLFNDVFIMETILCRMIG
jgi:hypothetical protein